MSFQLHYSLNAVRNCEPCLYNPLIWYVMLILHRVLMCLKETSVFIIIRVSFLIFFFTKVPLYTVIFWSHDLNHFNRLNAVELLTWLCNPLIWYVMLILHKVVMCLKETLVFFSVFMFHFLDFFYRSAPLYCKYFGHMIWTIILMKIWKNISNIFYDWNQM